MSQIDKRLAEIEARAKAATPGPWKTRLDDNDHNAITGTEGENIGTIHRWEYETLEALQESETNAALVSNSRTDIPRLVAALRVADSAIRREEAAAQSAGRVSQAARLRGTKREIEAALKGADHAAD